jgi:hypothetical protein
VEFYELVAQAEASGVAVMTRNIGRHHGRYLLKHRLIMLSPRLSGPQTISALAHELGHAFYGDDGPQPPELEARAWRWAACALISPSERSLASSVSRVRSSRRGWRLKTRWRTSDTSTLDASSKGHDVSNLGWTKADREADEERYRQRKQAELEQAKAVERKDFRSSALLLLLLAGLVVAALALGVRWLMSAGPDSEQLASTLDAEIWASGDTESGALSTYTGARDDKGGAVAVTTTLLDKTENEEVAQRICSALTTFRLRDGLEGLRQVRILSSADTTLAYCD